jgi:hypothetical protein
MLPRLAPALAAVAFTPGFSPAAEWLLGTAYKLPSEYTNQESG